MQKIRHNQKITLDFSLKNERVVVKSTHKFSYMGKIKGNISIFSDFRGLSPGQSALQDLDDKKLLEQLSKEWPRFRFTEIKDNDVYYNWENAENHLNKYIDGSEADGEKAAKIFRKLIRLEKNKLFYEGKSEQSAYKRDFNFVIHGEYNKDDRLVWCIQDISEEFDIVDFLGNPIFHN